MFKELFLAILLIFWLHSVEEFRDGELFEPNDKKHGLKVIAAAVYFVLAVITYTWSDIADRRDPVLASPFELPGVVVFYVFTVVALTAMIAWLVVLTVLAVPKIAHSPLMFTRFLYLSIPSLVVALIVLVGAYCGNYGTGNKNSFQLMLFTTLYNVYTWLLVFGFWPVSGKYESLLFHNTATTLTNNINPHMHQTNSRQPQDRGGRRGVAAHHGQRGATSSSSSSSRAAAQERGRPACHAVLSASPRSGGAQRTHAHIKSNSKHTSTQPKPKPKMEKAKACFSFRIRDYEQQQDSKRKRKEEGRWCTVTSRGLPLWARTRRRTSCRTTRGSCRAQRAACR